MIQSVEERPDIEVQHPVTPPAALPRLPQCLVSRFPRSIAVGVRMKVFFQFRLQYLFHHRLGYPILHRWYPQRTNAAVRLGNLNSSNRRRMITARRHAVPKLVQVVSNLGLERFYCLAVNPRPTLIGFHLLPGFPDLTFADGKRLRPVHQGPPVAGFPDFPNRIGRPLRSSPITELSSLLRVAPPLCSASVLSRSWGLHLRFFLGIEATGSHVPHKSLDRGLATFVPDAIRSVSRFLPNSPRGNDYPSVLTSSTRFRHVDSGSLAFDSASPT